MLDSPSHADESIASLSPGVETTQPVAPVCLLRAPVLERLVQELPLRRRRMRARQYLFRAGQPRNGLYLIHAGFFKARILSEDGREKITGFRMRGDLLGMEALDMPRYTCDAVALDVGEVWELPQAQLRELVPDFRNASPRHWPVRSVVTGSGC